MDPDPAPSPEPLSAARGSTADATDGRRVGGAAEEAAGAQPRRRRADRAKPTAEPGDEGAERLRRAMQVDTVGIVFFDSAGGVSDCNEAFLRMTGLAPHDLAERRVRLDDLTAPEWRAVSAQALDAFREGGRPAPIEQQLVRPDGTRWWALVAATRIADDQGVAFVIDVTDRRRAEAERRAVQAEFEAMFELSSVGQCQVDLPSGTILRTNRRFCAMLARPPDELIGARFEDLVHPDERAVVAAQLESLRGDRATPTPFAARLVRGDGHVVWVEGDLTPMPDEHGVAARMAATVRDISAQKLAERALAESRARLRLILESARDYAILSMDLERRVTSWNPGAEQITGYSEVEIAGRSADIVFTPEDRARGEAEREAEVALASGRAANERWHQRKDGSRFWGSGVLMSMLDEAGRPVGFVKIFRDQTEARQWHESLQESRAQLWEALRENERARGELQAASRAKDHFLAVLSHELRTPLTPVLMAAQALGMRHDLPAGVRPALEMIQRNVRIEARFIDDLLDLTRISRGELEILREPFEVGAAVRRAVEACKRAIADKEIALEVELDAGEAWSVGDAARIEQAVANVLKNAVKFTPGQGRIWVRSERCGDALCITVRDDGIGIEPRQLDGIFGAFSQAGDWVAREYGGLGLGLAIARASVEAHGGSIRASSAGRNQGTTLAIELPLTR